MTQLAITVLGHDRPGIIAQTAEALAGCEMNLEDSSMTLLRGHFAMTLICSGGAGADRVRDALGPLAADSSLSVDVREVPEEQPAGASEPAYLITVHGADRLGIVARLTGVIAATGGNITDLTTRLSGTLYVLVAEVVLPEDADPVRWEAALHEAAAELGVGVTVRPVERDEL
jgi:glycine cleavage system transcriptional repressor